MKRSKYKAQRAHARRRAKERFALDLNKAEYLELVKRIQGNEAKFIERQSNRITVWELDVKGELCRIVYDKCRASIVTFLPVKEPENGVEPCVKP